MFTQALLLSAIALASATPIRTRSDLPVCKSFIKSFTVDSTNPAFSLPIPSGEADVTNAFTDYLSLNTNFTSQYLIGPVNNTETYEIYIEYCEPAGGRTKSPALLTTHGLNFDHSYWDFTTADGNTEYNFIVAATNQGYGVINYDRLGVARSSRPNGINMTQAPTEIAIANAIVEATKAGTLLKESWVVNHNFNVSYAEVVGVGHSFGSIISQGVTAAFPDAFTAVALTGWTTNHDAGSEVLAGSNFIPAAIDAPSRFSGYSYEYLVYGTTQGNRMLFFYGDYDEAVYQQAWDAKQTVSIGEVLSLGGPAYTPGPAMEFKGDVLVVTGDHDFIFCAGGCIQNGTSLPAASSVIVPSASSFETYIAANTGHGMNLHASAPATYAYIFQWLASKGL